MIKTVIIGAAGRMGRMLVANVAKNPNFELAGATEYDGSPELGKDAGVLAGVGVFNQLVDSIITSEGDLKYILARLVVAVIVGLLANVFTDPILILTTSALGGMTGGISLMVAIGQTGDTTVETVVGLALTVIGIIVQFRMGRKKKK